jgi:hypothetical protein
MQQTRGERLHTGTGAAACCRGLRLLAPSLTAAVTDEAVSQNAAAQTVAAVVHGVSAGAFANAMSATNSGRAVTESCDAISADDHASIAFHIGFYAAGTLAADCTTAAAGSNAIQGGMTTYWGDGAGGRDAAAFTFGGNNSYTVTLAIRMPAGAVKWAGSRSPVRDTRSSPSPPGVARS